MAAEVGAATVATGAADAASPPLPDAPLVPFESSWAADSCEELAVELQALAATYDDCEILVAAEGDRRGGEGDGRPPPEGLGATPGGGADLLGVAGSTLAVVRAPLTPRGTPTLGAWVTGKLEVRVPGGYPSAPARVLLAAPRGLSEAEERRLLEELEVEASEHAGGPALGAVLFLAGEELARLNRPRGPCPICLDDLATGEEGEPGPAGSVASRPLALPCAHGFHAGCLARAWASRPRERDEEEGEAGATAAACPSCRTEVAEAIARRVVRAVAKGGPREGEEAGQRGGSDEASAPGSGRPDRAAGSAVSPHPPSAPVTPLSDILPPDQLLRLRAQQEWAREGLARQRAAGGGVEVSHSRSLADLERAMRARRESDAAEAASAASSARSTGEEAAGGPARPDDGAGAGGRGISPGGPGRRGGPGPGARRGRGRGGVDAARPKGAPDERGPSSSNGPEPGGATARGGGGARALGARGTPPTPARRAETDAPPLPGSAPRRRGRRQGSSGGAGGAQPSSLNSNP